MLTEKLLQSILNNRLNKEGFTLPLKWEKKRYIIALTNNTWTLDIKKLTSQYNSFNYNNLNVWGWLDKNTLQYYIDISTSLDSLEEARKLWKLYKQIAVWDSEKNIEIIL
jgi:hypothetical protein